MSNSVTRSVEAVEGLVAALEHGREKCEKLQPISCRQVGNKNFGLQIGPIGLFLISGFCGYFLARISEAVIGPKTKGG